MIKSYFSMLDISKRIPVDSLTDKDYDVLTSNIGEQSFALTTQLKSGTAFHGRPSTNNFLLSESCSEIGNIATERRSYIVQFMK